MRTITPNVSEADRKWLLIDANGVVLGRLASTVAQILRGKHKANYTPHLDLGDHVIIINAEKIRVTGRKAEQKQYYRHSGYPGGMKVRSYSSLIDEKPAFILEHAIKGMLPKNRLGRQMFRKLRVYVGSDHPHTAQQPETFKIN
ncbi:50S ribosomal protein L13 [candidate division KSB1 bacterium]|nr:50S ribosomal protein L13 [candidate division KSB1 bacterium]